VPATATDVGAGHARGTAGYRRLVGAVWAAGVGSFTLLYAPQAVLPLISQDLDVSPSTAALTVSVTTATLAVSLLPMSYLADRVGRTRLMTVSLLVAAVLGLLAPLAPSIGLLLAVRAVQGVAIAGLPALAMAHVSEEVRPSAVGVAMGLFVAGNTVGGLSGRVLASTVADAGGWRASPRSAPWHSSASWPSACCSPSPPREPPRRSPRMPSATSAGTCATPECDGSA
jgi:YNFM family putative membrane transporter